MFKILFLIFISAVMFNKISGQTNGTEKFSPAKLSPEGQIAYQTLLEASGFQEPVFQKDEELPAEIKSFNVLADEKYADETFKLLLNEATMAGQLYALCGIYYTDNEFFKKSVEKYRADKNLVIRVNKDLKFWFKISDIVESNEPNVAIILPNETLQDFWKKVKGGYVIDILRGGFSATFRRYKDFNKDKI